MNLQIFLRTGETIDVDLVLAIRDQVSKMFNHPGSGKILKENPSMPNEVFKKNPARHRIGKVLLRLTRKDRQIARGNETDPISPLDLSSVSSSFPKSLGTVQIRPLSGDSTFTITRRES